MYSASIATDGRDAPRPLLEKAAAGEAGGAERLWLANHLFQRDPVSLAAAVLAATPRLKVALMAISPFTQHPVQAAMAAATLDELFPGRVTLCFGVGAPADLDSVGIAADRPLKPMREALQMAKALLAGETVNLEGQAFRVRGRALASGASAVPVMLAASGPQMLELAGAAADGVLVSSSTSVDFVRWSLEHVQRGAAGRRVRACGLVYAAVGESREASAAHVRRLLAITLRGPHHARNLELAGTTLDQGRLREFAGRGDWAAAESLITEDVVRNHAACGKPEDVRARFDEYHAAGLDEIVIAGTRDGAQIALLLAAVAPAAAAAIKGRQEP